MIRRKPLTGQLSPSQRRTRRSQGAYSSSSSMREGGRFHQLPGRFALQRHGEHPNEQNWGTGPGGITTPDSPLAGGIDPRSLSEPDHGQQLSLYGLLHDPFRGEASLPYQHAYLGNPGQGRDKEEHPASRGKQPPGTGQEPGDDQATIRATIKGKFEPVVQPLLRHGREVGRVEEDRPNRLQIPAARSVLTTSIP